MGIHGGRNKRQIVSRPLLGIVLVAILVAASIVAWMKLGDRIEKDNEATGGGTTGCIEGRAEVPIVVDPGIAPALENIADVYNDTKPIVRDHCVEIAVRPGDARATLEGVTAAEWDVEAHGTRPAAWIPESSVWTAALQSAKPDAIAGAPESLVQSPVVFAVRPEMEQAAGGRVRWDQFPELTYEAAFEAYGHTAIRGSARLAMPQGPQADATALASQAYATNTVGGGPLTAEHVASDQIQVGLHQVMRAPPRAGDGTAEAAVKAIMDAPNMADAKVRSVPISEQRLFAATKDDQEARIALIRPRGSVPLLDFPVIRLAQDVPAHQADALAEFLDFVREPEKATMFTTLGFRMGDAKPEPSATVDFPDLGDRMPAAEPDAVVAVSRVVLPAAIPGE